ncbi:hypothetical protein [Xenorhabdus siamensis]
MLDELEQALSTPIVKTNTFAEIEAEQRMSGWRLLSQTEIALFYQISFIA